MELAEGVEFIEKYAHLEHLEAPFGGGGSPVQMETCRAGGAHLGNGWLAASATLDPPKQSFSKYVPKPELGNEEETKIGCIAPRHTQFGGGCLSEADSTRWKGSPSN